MYSIEKKNQYIYQYKDHLGNVRVNYYWDKIQKQLAIIDINNYYPFGMNFSDDFLISNNSADTHKYNGKEYIPQLNMYDYGARFYMPDIGRWGVVDPLAEKYRRWSPYNYGVDNPIRFTDPDGMGVTDVIIGGDLGKKAFEQLQARASNLNLTMDEKGRVKGTVKDGATVTKAEQKLLDAINDTSVVVNFEATSSNEYMNGPLVGGVFGGSSIDDKGIVQTNQVVNPNQAEIIEGAFGFSKGSVVMHEMLESYIGGKNNPGAFGNATGDDPAYMKAHSESMKLQPMKFNGDVSFEIVESSSKSRFGTVKMFINTFKSTPVLKKNGEPRPGKFTSTSVKTLLGIATSVIIK